MAARRVGLLLMARLSHASGITWVKAGSGSEAICAGIEEQCDSVESCTMVAWGPCGGLSEPSAYISGQIVRLAQISGADGAYLTDNSLIVQETPSTVANNKYRDYGTNISLGAATVSMVNSGAFFGYDPTVSGAYLGTASYLVQSGSAGVRTVPVMVATTPGSTDTVSPDVCIRPKAADGSCGAADSVDVGAYKFSIFGYSRGSNFQVVPAANWVAVRVRSTIVNFAGGFQLTFNGDGSTLDTIGTRDVTQFNLAELGGQRRQLRVTFPSTYNVGAVGSNYAVPEATRTVKIKVSRAAADAIFVDYLFDLNDFRVADRYMIYDPTVTAPAATTAATTAAPGTTALTTGMSASTTTATRVATAGAGHLGPCLLLVAVLASLANPGYNN